MASADTTRPAVTPHGPTAGGIQFAAVGSSANHQHLHNELSGHVVYDDPSVFARLRVFEEDATTIARCHARYQVDMQSQLTELRRMAKEATTRDDGDTEGKQETTREEGHTKGKQETTKKAGNTQAAQKKRKLDVNPKKAEQEMYKPLVRLALLC